MVEFTRGKIISMKGALEFKVLFNKKITKDKSHKFTF